MHGGSVEARSDGPGQGSIRPALGTFSHEAVTVDPVRGQLYLTEDGDGGDELYRFTPDGELPDLSDGALEVAVRAADGSVSWLEVDPLEPSSLRRQRAGAPVGTAFPGNEGVWYDAGHVYFTNKGDQRVWDLDVEAQQLEVLYEAGLPPQMLSVVTGWPAVPSAGAVKADTCRLAGVVRPMATGMGAASLTAVCKPSPNCFSEGRLPSGGRSVPSACRSSTSTYAIADSCTTGPIPVGTSPVVPSAKTATIARSTRSSGETSCRPFAPWYHDRMKAPGSPHRKSARTAVTTPFTTVLTPVTTAPTMLPTPSWARVMREPWSSSAIRASAPIEPRRMSPLRAARGGSPPRVPCRGP